MIVVHCCCYCYDYYSVTQILNQESNIELLIQAAATLGSFGKSDAAECVHALTMSNAVHALLNHVIVEREVTQEKQLKLVETCIRSLKIIFETKGELASTFDLLLRNERVVPCLIRLLSPIARMDSINEVTASLIARCCRTEAHQSSIMNAGGLESLFSLMFSTYPKVYMSSLSCDSAIRVLFFSIWNIIGYIFCVMCMCERVSALPSYTLSFLIIWVFFCSHKKQHWTRWLHCVWAMFK